MRRTALLLRVNAWHELLGTYHLPDEIKQRFQVDAVSTIATPQTDTLTLLQHDTNFDEVLLFPANKDQPKTVGSWRSFISQKKFDICVLAFHAELPEKCGRHVIPFLFCKGKKYFYITEKGFFGLYSKEGLKLLSNAFSYQLLRKIKLRWAHWLCKKDRMQNVDLTKQPIKRILWMRPDHLGDVIMTLPTLTTLKRYFPEARIDALVRSESVSMLRAIPQFNEIDEIDIAPFTKPMSNAQFQTLKKKMRDRHYDLAIDFRGDDTLRKLMYQLNIPCRVGLAAGSEYEIFDNYSFYNSHCVSLPPGESHYVEQNLALLDQVGLHPDKATYVLPTLPSSSLTVKNTLLEHNINSPIAILHAHSLNRSKDWVPERFAEVANYLIERYGLTILLNGSKHDHDYNENIRKLSQSPHVHNACGWFSLTDLPALFQLTKIMVTADSGPMHMAAAVATPIVALVLPSLVERIYPYKQRSTTLTVSEEDIESLLSSGNFNGYMLEAITVDDVTKKIDSLLAG